MIAACTTEQLVALRITSATIDSRTFRDFLQEVRDNILRYNLVGPGGIVLFFDNASIHKTKEVRSALGQLRMPAVTNCPYAPDLNFCELFIRLHKQKIGQHLDMLK